MSRNIAVVLAVGLLTACSSAAEQLEANYETTVGESGSNTERCDADREIAAAYAKEGDEAKYDDWKGKSVMSCLRASVLP